MNKLLRQFLSGGSLAALQLCAMGATVRAANITNARSKYTVATATGSILVTGTGNVSGNITNNGTIGVGANGYGIAVQDNGQVGGIVNSAAGNIKAYSTGIDVQTSSLANTLVGSINNAGQILVSLGTHASSRGSDAAIRYNVRGNHSLALTNSGTIAVSATRSKTNAGSFAATARGIFERNADAGGNSPGLTLANSGSGVNLKAKAVATGTSGSTRAHAYAFTALDQYETGANSATLSLTNTAAPLSVAATAHALMYVGGDAYATAGAEGAIEQFASAASGNTASNVITGTITNSGAIGMAAVATASGVNDAHGYAYAYVVDAITQGANRAGDAELSITNSGALTLSATANGHSLPTGSHTTASTGHARATVGFVIYQDANVNNSASAALSRKANLTITNSGTLSATAKAKATGSNAQAQATIETVVKQHAQGQGVITETLTNTNTGTLTLGVQATALATSDYARATARLQQVLYQSATDRHAAAADSSITQSLTNNAGLTITGAAKATEKDAFNCCSIRAHASAKAHEVFEQSAQYAIAIAQTMSNTGSISITEHAAALATNARASGSNYRGIADAGVSGVFLQYGRGTSASTRQTHSSIGQTLTNSGALTINLTANGAEAKGPVGVFNTAQASARAENILYQEAYRATTISQSLTNSGGLNIHATATAKATGADTAYAHGTAGAYVSDVLHQYVSNYWGAYYNPASATQTLTNNGSLSLAAAAHFTASGVYGHAKAHAEVDEVFAQTSYYSQTANQSITNTGTLVATALASTVNRDAQRDTSCCSADNAKATLDDIFYQYDYDYYYPHASATQAISNTASLSLTATATAKLGAAGVSGTASTHADAVVDDIFYQDAYYGIGTVSQTVSNTGAVTLKAVATATALGTAQRAGANAYIGTVADQYAYLYHYSGDVNKSVTQSITNSGTLNLTASAMAKGVGMGANTWAASANATIENLFNQYVVYGHNVTQTITNSGAMTLKSSATATGTGVDGIAHAKAEATDLFYQQAYADSGAVEGGAISQTITNSGAIGLTLSASANGKAPGGSSAADATASAANLFRQTGSADSSSVGSVNQSISNSGAITISNTAISTTTKDDDYAEADIFGIYYQHADDAGAITQAVTNSAPVTITLAATARGALNEADASASFGSLIYQYASDARTVMQNATISNTGAITITANATAVSATAGEEAYAEAEMDDAFVEQKAEDINSGAISQTVLINAPIKMTLGAVATGVTEATAEARMNSRLVYQNETDAEGSPLTQSITNSGAITLAFNAKAKGRNNATGTQTHGFAEAKATLDSQLFYQYGEETGKPVNQTITNSGNLSVSLVAAATASHASARANINDTFVEQYATADIPGAGTLTQSLTNSGVITVALTAQANGRTRATASANLTTEFVRQTGRRYAEINQSITNTGNISITQTARAGAANAVHADVANADFDSIFYQSAESALVTTAAGVGVTQTITNSASLSIKNAATATGKSQVTARAGGDEIFEQFDREGATINQKVNNSGAIAVTLTAKAKTASARTAVAEAGFYDLISQEVEQSEDAGQIANLSITNSGSITLAAAATATNAGTLSHEAFAEAHGERIFQQEADESLTANLSLTNSATITLTNSAKANGKGEASVDAVARFAEQSAYDGSNYTMSVTNSGKVTLSAAGTAVATNSAKARGEVFGIFQGGTGLHNNTAPAPTAALSINNSGTLSLTAMAKAQGGNGARAQATATGAEQEQKQNGTVGFSNSGTVSVSATATILAGTAHVAAATGVTSYAVARAEGLRVTQAGSSFTAVTNDASASPTHHSVNSPLTLSNSGSFTVAAVAVGAGVNHAKATASAFGFNVQATSQIAQKGVSHSASGVNHQTNTSKNSAEPLKGSISNSGSMSVSATAAGGKAVGYGIMLETNQEAASIANAAGGTLAVNVSGATALAAGISVHNYMHTHNRVYRQTGYGTSSQRHVTTLNRTTQGPVTTVSGNITNSGSLTVSSTGTVSGKADGIAINAATVSSTILNAGTLSVTLAGPVAAANGIHLFASQTGQSRTFKSHRFFSASHFVTTYSPVVTNAVNNKLGNVVLSGTISNTGTLSVSATVTSGSNGASANGINVEGGTLTGASILNVGGTINATATGKTANANDILLTGAGAITVSDKTGKLNATATASAGAAVANGVNLSDATLGSSTFTGGGGTVSANATGGAATANGWFVTGAGKITMTGSGGVLTVKANSSNAVATANGINIQGGALTGSSILNGDTINVSATGATGTTPVANAILVVGTGALTVGNASTGNLSSTITVGSTTSYGTAINVNGAASAAIALQGGTIAGNILEASGGNAITVSGGNTTFNGSINPSKAQLGSLTIASTGTLTLGVNGGLGAGNAWVGTFTQTGTLALNETGDTTLSGAIHATTATLSGPAALNINVASSTPVGLSTTYKVVFTTGTLSGTFSSIAVTDPTFFTASGVYTANEADITLTRAALGAVPGLTPNESAVGGALEKIYDAGGGTGPLASLTNALFALTPAQYAEALQELSGTSVGDLANADATDLENTLDTIIDHLGDASGGGGAGGTAFNYAPGVQQAQLADGHFNVWAGGVAAGSGIASTSAGPGYHVNQNGLMAGVDAQFLPNTTLGLSLAYINGTMHTLNGLDRGGFNVIEVSGYGRYDAPNAPFYALGDVSYGAFNNTLHRTISIPGLASAVVNGKYSSDTVALYGEAGYHLSADQFPVSLTPYVAVSYLDASSDPFTETGNFVAPLAVASASSNSLYSYLGAQWQQTFPSDNNMAVTARIKAAWQHDFSNSAWTMAASFAPVSGIASFGIKNTGLSTDYAFIDAGVTISSSSNVDLNLDYDGHLASDRTENAIIGRLVFKF